MTKTTLLAPDYLSLWYRKPASTWLEALPIGNGRLGAMVFGDPANETLQLNEANVWAGGPHDYVSPEALGMLPEIRRLVLAGDYATAQKLTDAKFMGRPCRQAPYQTVGNLRLKFAGNDDASNYLRTLDLSTAIATVTYQIGTVTHTREVFASYPDQVIVTHFTASEPGQISFTATFDSPQDSSSESYDGSTIVLNGISSAVEGRPGEVKFTALARAIVEGGEVTTQGGVLSVSGSDSVTLIVSMGTSYRNYADVSGDPLSVAVPPLRSASSPSFEELRSAHIADYRKLFDRLTIDFGVSEASNRPTDERVETFGTDKDPALVALHCQYGRYLLIAASRGSGTPATLQGLWNDSLTPPWGSKYTVNINTEMNYWPAGPANLLECYDPLIKLIGEIAETGANTARKQYGAGGWVCHHNTDGWRGTAPVDAAFHGTWQTGGAWLTKSLWDHFEFSSDQTALARNYPIIKGSAQFFIDTLIEEPATKHLVTCPANSPENAHHVDASLCAGPAMDSQILRDLFDSCINAAALLGVDSEFSATVAATKARLAPDKIGLGGQLQEWLEDWDMEAPELDHRHVSHLYAVYPSNQINWRDTPELTPAAQKSLEIRGDESTGWAIAWRINLWARLLDGDHAHKLIENLLSPSRTAPNLFDLHPPFQIDGNFGATSGVIEMLLQSQLGELHLLPALPSAWTSGRVQGILARGGALVDIVWAEGKLVEATIAAKSDVSATIRYGNIVLSRNVVAGEVLILGARDFR